MWSFRDRHRSGPPTYHEIYLYCDDVLLYLSKPESSIRKVAEITILFANFQVTQ